MRERDREEFWLGSGEKKEERERDGDDGEKKEKNFEKKREKGGMTEGREGQRCNCPQKIIFYFTLMTDGRVLNASSKYGNTWF